MWFLIKIELFSRTCPIDYKVHILFIFICGWTWNLIGSPSEALNLLCQELGCVSNTFPGGEPHFTLGLVRLPSGQLRLLRSPFCFLFFWYPWRFFLLPVRPQCNKLGILCWIELFYCSRRTFMLFSLSYG